MPPEGIKLLNHSEILTFNEIYEVVRIAVEMGIDKVRITGGEPLVRKGIVNLVSMISQIKGIIDLSMTTNGVLLEEFAEPLSKAGLQRINISLDTLNPEKYKDITRGGDINKVLNGINAAKAYGLYPIKINSVVNLQESLEEVNDIKNYCRENGLLLQLINKMNLEAGEFSIVDGGNGGDCKNCNRIRLTANGKIKPCLFNNTELDVRELGTKEAILQAIRLKPEQGTNNNTNHFYNIGG